LTTRVKPS